MVARRPPKQIRLTQAQLDQLDERVFAFIRSYQLGNGVPPSRAEIASGLGLSGIMAAQRSVERLKQKGKLRFDKNAKRGLEDLTASADLTANKQTDWVELPLLGAVAAGCPIETIEAIENAERMQVPRSFLSKNFPHFVLKIRGDSMMDDHICDGDFVIIRQQESANNGDRVVALIDNEATLKRFYRKMDRIELHPANPNHSPIIVESHHHFRIAGVYVGLIRFPHLK